MTEMEIVRDLRRVFASIAGQAGGNREAVKAEIRQELVSAVKERSGWAPGRGSHDGPVLRQVQPGRPMRSLPSTVTDFGGMVHVWVCRRCGIVAVATQGERVAPGK
jgi:hypothetical protein